MADGVGLTCSSSTATRGRPSAPRWRAGPAAKVIKAAPVGSRADLQALEPFHTDYHLLDAHRAGLRGGTGETFDWELVAQRRTRVAADRVGRPDAGQRRPRRSPRRDPSPSTSASGVEAEPGRKDPAKLRGLLRGGDARARHRRSRREPRRAPLRPLRRPVRARDADARAGRARGGLGRRRATTPASAPSSTRCCATTSAARRRCTAPTGCREAAGRAGLPQARGPDPHRRAQDQQRARPGAARQAHGQAADHRRDRRRPARRRDGDGVRAARPGVRRLHGRRGHAPPGAQRRAHGAARRDRVARSRPGRATLKEATQRGDPRLGDQRRRHALRHRLGGRPGALPGDRARPPARDRRRGARAAARARGPAARRA